MPEIENYQLYYQFVDKFVSSGFLKIDRSDLLIQKIEEMTEANNQFIFVADILQLKILFTSRRSFEMLGIEPELLEPSIFFTATHPDDLTRHNLARTKLFSLGQELFISHKGKAIISTNFRLKHKTNQYTNMLVQCYLFHSWLPYETVFLLQVFTDVSWFKALAYGYHFYSGSDLEYFRYPEERLMLTGHNFSEREFEIINLIAAGLNSRQIAAKIYRSVHTINTHRRNILIKSKRHSTNELILDLKARGML